jgi:hypothetical protein
MGWGSVGLLEAERKVFKRRDLSLLESRRDYGIESLWVGSGKSKIGSDTYCVS